MIELYRDSSGEVDITSGQKATNTKTAVIANIASSAEDENKIAELRNTIESLKSQIQASVCSGCCYLFPFVCDGLVA